LNCACYNIFLKSSIRNTNHEGQRPNSCHRWVHSSQSFERYLDYVLVEKSNIKNIIVGQTAMPIKFNNEPFGYLLGFWVWMIWTWHSWNMSLGQIWAIVSFLFFKKIVPSMMLPFQFLIPFYPNYHFFWYYFLYSVVFYVQ
jgi:hypothetical protein